ncbi:MAG: Ig-like domain-containing protein [Paludibacteraceae bacterium]|nr:Ig-like domain-containing protein [Paludibacteraceae bacterium]
MYDATDVSLEHTGFSDNANKTGCSGKLTTTTAKGGYVEVTFKIADGYKFTPTEVKVQGIAVSSNKTIEVELTDNATTPNSKSVSGTLTAVSSPASGGYTVTLDFDETGTIDLEGTVTAKIYAYGADNHWRMGTPLVITGTVSLDCSKPGTPANLAVSEKSHNSATFGWDAAEHADGYKVRLEQGSTVVVDWTDCAINSYTKSDLTPETAYTFKVKAKGATGYCELGDEATVNVTTDAEPAANPVITGAVNEAGWGTVSDAITVTSGKTVAIADNILTCDEKTLTATATTATTEYTYAFDHWSGISNGDAVTANITVTANFTRTANSYDVTRTAPSNGSYTIKVGDATAVSTSTTAAYGSTVTLAATPAEGYEFVYWTVVPTAGGEAITVTNNQFIMPAEAVTISATFVVERKKILYLTSATTEGDKLYDALKDDYNVTVAAPDAQTLTDYDLVVLHESINGKAAASGDNNNKKQVILDIPTTTIPVLNTKSYFYNNANTDNQRWNWGTPNSGKKTMGVHVNTAYCDITTHPLFNDLTPDANDSIIILSSISSDNKPIQPIGTFTTGKEGYTLANVPDGCAIHELTPAQRGVASGKYLLISVYNKDLNNLNANGQKLFQNAAAYLLSDATWTPTAPKTVTHTLANVTKKSGEASVCAGVAYSATYEAVSGYTLPADVVVKVNGTAINSGYTWTQATGTLAIEAAQVTNNIEIVVNGEFNCPAASSGDIVFKWDAKTGSAEAEYLAAEAEGVDISGYVDNMVGGSANAYGQVIGEGPNTTWYRNTDNCLYFNGNDAYLKLNVCALQEGDKIEIASAEGKNIWIATSSTRPADASAAAAVIEHGSAFYISSTSALIDATEIYLFREDGFTKIGSLTVTRSKKFTVTYDSSEPLTGGATPAPEYAFDGQSLVIVDGTTMENGAKHFNGWKDSNDNDYAVGANFTPTANITLYAQWAECTPLTLNLTGYATELLAGGATTTATLDKGTSTGAVTWESSNTEVLTVANGVITPVKGGTATVTAHVAEDATYCESDVTSAEITVKATVHYDANAGGNETGTMEDGVGASVTVVANAFAYADHKFLRWNTQPDGQGTDVAVGATTNENMTLYAIWKEVNCAPGTIFSLEMKTGLSNENIDPAGYKEMSSDYATVTGGSAILRNDGSDNTKARIYNSNIYLGGAAGYVVVELDCPLQVNDVIAFTGDNSNAICFTLNGTRATDYATSDGEFTVSSAFLNGNNNATTVYVWRQSGNGTTIHSLTVTRPAPDAPVPSITTNPANASYTGSDPILPMTVVAEVTGAEDLHYQWYKVGDLSDVEVGDDAASYTPIASGEYYCVVTNSPTGYTAKSATSTHATITMISSDATLAWLKAWNDNITLTNGEYDYTYVLADTATMAPVVTAGKNEEHATVTITQATTKTGTATVHVVAEDGTTYHDYTVKFNEFVGCRDAYWFAKSTDAPTGKENNSSVFASMQGDGTDLAATFNIDGVDYTVTRATSAKSSFGQFTIPTGFNATVYVALKTGGTNRGVSLVPTTSGTTYSSDTYATAGNYVVEFNDVAAGTYAINGTGGNSNFAVVKVTMCKYPVQGVSLPATESVYKDQSITLTPTFTPAEASNKSVTWQSDDETVATVVNGVVTGVAAGSANITVTTADGGYQAVCVVTVVEMDCETYVGNLFSFEVVATENKQYTSVGTGNAEKVIGAEVATVTSGQAYAGYTSNTATIDVANKQSNVWYYKFGDSNTYLKVQLANCALKAGDVITMTALQDIYISTSATYPSQAENRIEIKHATDAKYMIKPGDILEGQSTIYLWRKSGSTYLKNISIKRVPPFDANRTTLKVNSYGTFCYPQAVAEGMYTGATFYRILEKTGIGFVLEEVRSLEAGRPYMFVAEANTIYVDWSGDAVTEPVNGAQNYGLVGANFDTDYTPVPSYYDGHNCYILSNNHIYLCGNNCQIAKYRAYIDYDAVPEAGQGTPANVPAGAPALRRIVVGKDNATAIDNLTEFGNGATATKLIIDGQLYILRGGHMFDATGRLVK